MNEMIAVNGLSKQYGKFTAVDDISFSIAEGEFIGLIGPNGSGKTTTLKMLSGLLTPSDGTIKFDGRDVVEETYSAMKYAGCAIGSPELYGNMTPEDILRYAGRLFQIPEKELNTRIDDTLSKVGMLRWKKKRTRTFSKGMKQRVIIAQALINNPKILILDEPASGLDPIGMNDMYTLLKDLNSSGTTILMSSHLLNTVDKLCSRILMLNHGRIIMEGKPEEIIITGKPQNFIVKTADVPSDEDLEKVREISGIFSAEKAVDGLKVKINGTARDQADLMSSLVGMGISAYSIMALESLEDIFVEAVGAEDEV